MYIRHFLDHVYKYFVKKLSLGLDYENVAKFIIREIIYITYWRIEIYLYLVDYCWFLNIFSYDFNYIFKIKYIVSWIRIVHFLIRLRDFSWRNPVNLESNLNVHGSEMAYNETFPKEVFTAIYSYSHVWWIGLDR
jgi:hypothetical protein